MPVKKLNDRLLASVSAAAIALAVSSASFAAQPDDKGFVQLAQNNTAGYPPVGYDPGGSGKTEKNATAKAKPAATGSSAKPVAATVTPPAAPAAGWAGPPPGQPPSAWGVGPYPAAPPAGPYAPYQPQARAANPAAAPQATTAPAPQATTAAPPQGKAANSSAQAAAKGKGQMSGHMQGRFAAQSAGQSGASGRAGHWPPQQWPGMAQGYPPPPPPQYFPPAGAPAAYAPWSARAAQPNATNQRAATKGQPQPTASAQAAATKPQPGSNRHMMQPPPRAPYPVQANSGRWNGQNNWSGGFNAGATAQGQGQGNQGYRAGNNYAPRGYMPGRPQPMAAAVPPKTTAGGAGQNRKHMTAPQQRTAAGQPPAGYAPNYYPPGPSAYNNYGQGRGTGQAAGSFGFNARGSSAAQGTGQSSQWNGYRGNGYRAQPPGYAPPQWPANNWQAPGQQRQQRAAPGTNAKSTNAAKAAAGAATAGRPPKHAAMPAQMRRPMMQPRPMPQWRPAPHSMPAAPAPQKPTASKKRAIAGTAQGAAQPNAHPQQPRPQRQWQQPRWQPRWQGPPPGYFRPAPPPWWGGAAPQRGNASPAKDGKQSAAVASSTKQ